MAGGGDVARAFLAGEGRVGGEDGILRFGMGEEGCSKSDLSRSWTGRT